MNSLVFLCLLALIPAIYANVKCYHGSQTIRNGYSDSPFPTAIDCSDKYCRVEWFSAYDGSVKYDYDCGSNPGNDGQICTSSSETSYSTNLSPGSVTKRCCKGDYCNSSQGVGSLLAVGVSVFALFVNKLV